MTIETYAPKRTTLMMLLPIAAMYLVWQRFWPAWTGRDWVDSAIGVVLGLYVCSRPAANGIDLFFAERGTLRRIFTRSSGFEWLVLNTAVMVIGWLVIMTAVSRLPATGESLWSVQP